IIRILIAVLLAYIMDPLVTLLRRSHIPLWLSVLISALFFLSIFLGFGIILYQSSLDFAREFPRYQVKFLGMIRDIFSKIQFAADEIIKTNLLEELKKIPAGSIVLSAISSIANFITDFIVVFLFSVLFL
ncbi:unnamed protein product, partial [marine sediment metagenome]